MVGAYFSAPVGREGCNDALFVLSETEAAVYHCFCLCAISTNVSTTKNTSNVTVLYRNIALT